MNNINSDCLPPWAKIMTKSGITIIKDLKPGTEIWSKQGWTTVKDYRFTGIKNVYSYKTIMGTLYTTDNHLVITDYFDTKEPIAIAKNLMFLDNYFTKQYPILESNLVSTEPVFTIETDNTSQSFWCNGFNVSGYV